MQEDLLGHSSCSKVAVGQAEAGHLPTTPAQSPAQYSHLNIWAFKVVPKTEGLSDPDARALQPPR